MNSHRQDLFASLILATTRITSYHLYPTEYHIDFVQHRSRITPSGFADSLGVLGEDFVAVTADIASLHSICEEWSTQGPTPEQLNQVDGLQAWIESRLQDLRLCPCNEVVTSCILAAYLCTYGCWDGVWKSTLLPRVLTRELLGHLRSAELRMLWNGHWELLCWCICVGLVFAREPPVREGLAALRILTPSKVLVINELSRESALPILEKFIWSKVMYDHDYFRKAIGNNPRLGLEETPTLQYGNTEKSIKNIFT